MLWSNTQFVNTREMRIAIKLATAALIAAVGWMPVYASDATAAGGDSAGAATSNDDIDEIVVTANRRPEKRLSQADSSEHEEQPVAIYQDGTYVAIPAATGFPIYDVDHAEVLRGPQGTLFGRNATGGSVQFFSIQPTDTFAAGTSYTAGDYNLHRLEGFINGGNSEVSDRFAYYLSERDGFASATASLKI